MRSNPNNVSTEGLGIRLSTLNATLLAPRGDHASWDDDRLTRDKTGEKEKIYPFEGGDHSGDDGRSSGKPWLLKRTSEPTPEKRPIVSHLRVL